MLFVAAVHAAHEVLGLVLQCPDKWSTRCKCGAALDGGELSSMFSFMKRGTAYDCVLKNMFLIATLSLKELYGLISSS